MFSFLCMLIYEVLGSSENLDQGLRLMKLVSLLPTVVFCFSFIIKKCFLWSLTSLLDNTAGILARRSTFTIKDQTQYVLPVVVADSGSPALSSTSTLTIRVCSCHPADHCPTGGVEALALSMGVSIQTLLGTLVCLITLTGKQVRCGITCLHPERS